MIKVPISNFFKSQTSPNTAGQCFHAVSWKSNGGYGGNGGMSVWICQLKTTVQVKEQQRLTLKSISKSIKIAFWTLSRGQKTLILIKVFVLQSDSSCSSVKSHHRWDVPLTASLLPPSEPAASLHSREPSPSSGPLCAPAPTRRHSRSDLNPPRCSRRRPLQTAWRTQGSACGQERDGSVLSKPPGYEADRKGRATDRIK